MSQHTTATPSEPKRSTVAAPEWPRTVRTTIQPTVDLQVELAEWTDLSRQGLLLAGHDGTKIGD